MTCPMGTYPNNCVNRLGSYCAHCAANTPKPKSIRERLKAAKEAGRVEERERIIALFPCEYTYCGTKKQLQYTNWMVCDPCEVVKEIMKGVENE